MIGNYNLSVLPLNPNDFIIPDHYFFWFSILIHRFIKQPNVFKYSNIVL